MISANNKFEINQNTKKLIVELLVNNNITCQNFK